jgi:hypothetical protein
MKELIRHILQEETSMSLPNRFVYNHIKESNDDITKSYSKKKTIALKLLSSLKLEHWENKKYRMEYLATPKGTIIFMLSDAELSIQYEIYDILTQIMDNPESLIYFINDYVRNRGLSLDYIYVTRSGDIGKIEDDDDRVIQNIQESQNKNPLKQYFFKIWDKEKKEGKIPMIGNLERLGLTEKQNEIIQYFAEYMGWETNNKLEAIKMYLLNQTFTEEYITDMKDIPEGKITIKFTDIEIGEKPSVDEYYDESYITGEFVVLDGSFLETEVGETLHFSSGDIPMSDFVEHHDFKDAVSEIVEGFVDNILKTFGYKKGTITYPYVDFNW